MWDQEGVHDIYRSWRKILDGYQPARVLVAEAWVGPQERLARYVRQDEMHQAFNFEYLFTAWRASDQRRVIADSLAATASAGAPATWVLSNHDVIRHATRLGHDAGTLLPPGLGPTDPQPDHELGLRRARAATLLVLGLPGSVYLYQGEELGLPEDIDLPDEARQDPIWRRTNGALRGRDGCRVPLPWVAGAPSYGFGPGAASWLPQPELWARYALDQQRGVPGSTYELYRAALRVRRERQLGTTPIEWVDLGADVVAFTAGETLVAANLGTDPVALPGLYTPLLASDGGSGATVAGDTTVWAARM
jgi:alpha-glucosidase